MLAARVLFLIIALTGCRDKIEYHHVEFPGFSLEVPTSIRYDRDPLAEYRAGRVQARIGAHLVTVGWRLGAKVTLEEIPTLVSVLTAAAPNVDMVQTEPPLLTKVNGHDATRLDARVEKMKFSLIDITCGKRAVTVAVGTTGDLDAMRRRILASFDCHPVAAQDKAINTTAAPFGVDDPELLAGWHRMESDVFTISNGKRMVMMMQIPMTQIPRTNKLDQIVLGKALPALFSDPGASWTTERTETRPSHGNERTFYHGRMTADGETMSGAAAVWNCAGRGDAVLALALAPSSTDVTPAIDLVTKLRCASPDDPPLPLAPAPTDEAAAPVR